MNSVDHAPSGKKCPSCGGALAQIFKPKRGWRCVSEWLWFDFDDARFEAST